MEMSDVQRQKSAKDIKGHLKSYKVRDSALDTETSDSLACLQAVMMLLPPRSTYQTPYWKSVGWVWAG